MWQDKMRRLEAHGDEYKLAPVFKINALRMLMTEKAKEYFDLRDGDRFTADAAKSYEELMNKVKDYARRRKLDTAAQETMRCGGDPMDVGAACGHWDYNWEESARRRSGRNNRISLLLRKTNWPSWSAR